MWVLHRNIYLRSHAFLFAFWARTSHSTRTCLHNFEDNWWQLAPSAEPEDPITELFPSLLDCPLSNWASGPNESRMASEILNYPNSVLQPPLTRQDIHQSSQASLTDEEIFWRDLQVNTRRSNKELGSRKRIKHSHGHLSFPQETSFYSTVNSGSAHDHGNVKTVPNGASSSGESEVNEGQIPTQDNMFMLLDELGISTTAHPPPNVRNVAELPAPIDSNQPQLSENLKQFESNRVRLTQSVSPTGDPTQIALTAAEPPISINSDQPKMSRALQKIKHNRIRPTQQAPPASRHSRMGSEIAIPIIYEYDNALEKKLEMNYLRAVAIPWENMPPLPTVSKLKEGKHGFRAIRIANNTGKQHQSFVIMKLLYRRLLLQIYNSHLRFLHPPDEHTMHVRNIFDRMDQEIFNPETGVPLWGRTAKGFKEEFPKYQWGKIQKVLARYLSSSPRDKSPLDRLASHLIIRSYYGAHEYDQKTLGIHLQATQHTDALKKALMDPYFRQRYDFILKLSSGDKKVKKVIKHEGRKWAPDHLSSILYRETALEFEKKFTNSQGKRDQDNEKIKHADLPIVLLLGKKIGTLESMQVLAPPTSQQFPYCLRPFLVVYKQLIKVVELLHSKILKQLDITVDQEIQMRKDVLNWIGQEITSPKEGYPVFGKISSEVDYSTLVGQMLAGVPVFGAVQLAMIHYFSTSIKDYFPQAASTAAIVLATWYQFNHPNEFHILSLQNKIPKKRKQPH
ncbi:hypothetical protein PtB15_7B188 [Puccinia triticina]|nr:hypothetical protein PtB15_7B188 [Puccinia triticina]